MVKLGFIDFYLDEWHANNYPAWLRAASNGEVDVTAAFGLIDSPIGGRTTDQWCADMGINRCHTMEEVIEQCDGLIVLSPDNCEMHETLCQLPLRSGKPVYVDKTFAPDYETARRIFILAEESGTPCWSTSALRYAAEYQNSVFSEVTGICSWGPNDFETYSIHQLEPLSMLVKAPARRVMFLPGDGWYTLVVEFVNGVTATVSGYRDGSPFAMNVATKEGVRRLEITSDFFQSFIRVLADYFRTGIPPVSREETLAIMALRGAGKRACTVPGVWVPVES